MTERKPNASSQPFAELVVDIEDTIQYLKSDSRMYKHLTILLACIREQQAALRAINAEVQWFVSRRKNLDEAVDGDAVRSWADVLGEDLKPVRAALARWRLK